MAMESDSAGLLLVRRGNPKTGSRGGTGGSASELLSDVSTSHPQRPPGSQGHRAEKLAPRSAPRPAGPPCRGRPLA